MAAKTIHSEGTATKFPTPLSYAHKLFITLALGFCQFLRLGSENICQYHLFSLTLPLSYNGFPGSASANF